MAEDNPSRTRPRHLKSPSGLIVEANANGSIRRMRHHSVLLNLFLGNEVEGGPANVYLREPGEGGEAIGLLGPRSGAAVTFDERSMTIEGAWRDIRFTLTLVLAKSTAAWMWRLALENCGDAEQRLDVIYAQDLGLTDYGAARSNEYYVSQYVDHTPLLHPDRGVVVASRQNQRVGGRHPWCVIGSLHRAAGFATDALQLHGLATRAGRAPEALMRGLPGRRLQHEHAMAAIQDAPFRLAPGERVVRGFFGWFEADHPPPTSDADLAFADRAAALPEARGGPERASLKARGPSPAPGPRAFRLAPRDPSIRPTLGAVAAPASLFCAAPLFETVELTEREIEEIFGEIRQAERENGRLLSFFCGERSHVALTSKELRVLRPHGQILRTGAASVPDEAALTSTVWMSGVFHSQVTQGHVGVDRLLSASRGYLGFFRSQGQRIFVDDGTGWRLFDEPSAFEMTPDACRWFYKHEAGLIRIESRALTESHELRLSIDCLAGEPMRCLVSNHIALDGDDGADEAPPRHVRDEEGVFVAAAPESEVGRRFPGGGFRIDPLPGTIFARVAGDEALFSDGVSRRQPYLCLTLSPARSVGLRILGRLLPPQPATGAPPDPYWRAMSLGLRWREPPTDAAAARDVERLGEILPWFAQNALVHYLAPRGLEQFSGGSWGVRDVAQGPVEMLLALGRFDAIRDILRRLFAQQNPDGDWPQFFGVFERERCERASDSHGDIVFWPLLALARYLAASRDHSILEESVPFFAQNEDAAEPATIEDHVERALALIERRMIDGTHLVAYGRGDWNDTLQPVDPKMRGTFCSAWTVTLHYQTYVALADAFLGEGRTAKAAELRDRAEKAREDFRRLLIVDGAVAGLASFRRPGHIDYLLHPRDAETGVSYSLIAMIHAIIGGMFTPTEARAHLDLVARHLTAPDGARLFDRPIRYSGGAQTFFQRAESAAFFGREIGLMYTHAHLRYAEALWRYGDAEGFYRALRLANPIGMSEIAPAAALRQANCYYTSSDAAFADRYEARDDYDCVTHGTIVTEGGWRVYSSGPGVALRLIICCFLGLTQEHSALVLDPVIPPSLNGLRVELDLLGHRFEASYDVGRAGCGPIAARLNGADLPFLRRENPYRVGAAEIAIDAVLGRIVDGVNRLTVKLG
jgi:cellobiose phosphorylase